MPASAEESQKSHPSQIRPHGLGMLTRAIPKIEVLALGGYAHVMHSAFSLRVTVRCPRHRVRQF
jgi:hypothetical protein